MGAMASLRHVPGNASSAQSVRQLPCIEIVTGDLMTITSVLLSYAVIMDRRAPLMTSDL